MALRFVNEETGEIKNAVFCFTGKSPKTRPEMESMAIEAGASVTKSITNKTTILVIADANSMSTKARKARENGIDLISPSQFFIMCQSIGATAPEINYTTPEKSQIRIKKPKTTTKHSLVRRIEL